MPIKQTEFAKEVCDMVGWNIAEVEQDAYIDLLERTFEEIADAAENVGTYIQKNRRDLDNLAVKSLRRELAFPEGTVAVLPGDGDLVLHVRGLTEQQKTKLVKSLGRRVVGTSDAGLPKVGPDGKLEADPTQPGELPAVDRLIERTAQEVARRQSNPDEIGGPTQVSWRLT